MTKLEPANALQQLVDDLVNQHASIPSGVLLIDSPNLQWQGVSGLANPGTGLVMETADGYLIDSIAKIMTATIVMKLVESGQLNLGDRVGQFLDPELLDGLKDLDGQPFGGSVTIEHLLSHRSGLADDWNTPGFFDLIVGAPEKQWTPQETIEFVKSTCQPEFSPGEGFQYSDPGYNMLGLIIESVTGQSLHDISRAMLFEPLGMKHTYRPSHEVSRPSLPNREPAQRYLQDMECTAIPAVMTADWAGGGLVSTTADLNRFLRAFVRGDLFENSQTRDSMLQWKRTSAFTYYGFGVSRVNYAESDSVEQHELGEIWGHTGSSHNFMYYWPKYDTTMIGTLNQMVTATTIYETVARIMKVILEDS
jgi:D-alanyl-D-alanine carboxypeptidase